MQLKADHSRRAYKFSLFNCFFFAIIFLIWALFFFWDFQLYCVCDFDLKPVTFRANLTTMKINLHAKEVWRWKHSKVTTGTHRQTWLDTFCLPSRIRKWEQKAKVICIGCTNVLHTVKLRDRQTDGRTDWQTDTANIGNNSSQLMHSMQLNNINLPYTVCEQNSTILSYAKPKPH